MASTIKIQSVLDWARTFPKLTATLGNPVAGYSLEPTISIANTILQEVLAEPFNWKWNRALAAPFITNSLQQDYSTSITDLSWLENASRTDINNAANPKPIRGVEVCRELFPTSVQGTPESLCWVPNSEAICGKWSPNVTFSSPLGTPGSQMPIQPLTQIRDSAGNIHVVTGFGTTGSVQPTFASTPGNTTTDGSVTWTCLDPNGITLRLGALAPQTGQVWLISPVYQKKAPLLTSPGQTWGPIPDEFACIYREGFLAYAMKAADDARFEKQYLQYQAKIQQTLGAADREREEIGFYPAEGLTGSVYAYNVDGGPPPGTFGPAC